MVTKQQIEKACRLFQDDATVERVMAETELTRPAADRIAELVRQNRTLEEILVELAPTGGPTPRTAETMNPTQWKKHNLKK
jgi:transposase-like protein